MKRDFARSERRSVGGNRRNTTALGLVVALVAGVLSLITVLAAAPAPVAAYGDTGTPIISVGTVHTCGIASGAAKCWGENANGQLGDGSTTASTVPVQVQGLTSGVTAISASATQTCAIVSGAAKCWGLNTNGQLGNNSTTASSAPVQVQGLTSGVTAISTGTSHSCAIVSGAAKCWGLNTNGRLGNSSTTQSLVPVQVTGLTSGVTAISAGASHTCAVVGGAAKCWGLSTNGQVGNSSTLGSTSPVQVTGLTSGVTAISAGGSHSCAVASGAVKCWGLGTTGRLGNGADTQQTAPVQVQGLTTGATAVSAGFNGSCAIVSGASWCWGRTTMLATGSGGTSSNVPVVISGLTTGVAAVSYGSTHACAIVDTTAKCWGSNTNGHLGNGLTTTSLVPAQVSGLTSGVSTVAVNRPAASNGIACALKSSGGVMCWGANAEGTLGNGTQVSSGLPVQVTGLTSGVTEISIGNFHACAVVSGGAQCWGNNGAGAMGGLATNQRYTTPTALPGFESGVTSISAGNQFTCLVRSGAAYCSGNGGSGQLGNGAGLQSSTFVPVSGLGSGVTAVSTATSHACALQSGTVKCWGTNSDGLGNGSTTSNVPVTVSGLTGVTAISAGESTSCATNASGTWCWGSNFAGGFGDGSTLSSPTPVLTGFGAGATSLSAASTTCAIVSGGAQCAGLNTKGAVGNGTTSVSSSTPVAPTGLTSGVTSIATNSSWSCAAVAGAAKCWGEDSDGQLGRLDTLRPGDVSGGYSWGASSNTVPVATATSVYAVPGTAKAITLTGTDEDSDPLTFSVTVNPTKGSVSCSSAGACTYTATAGESGSDSFQFTANDGQATSAAATISLSLSPPAAPTISGSRSPAANANGWNNEPVTVSFTCGSPVLASCTSPVTVSTDGSDQSASGTATDEYGQTTSTTVTGISIDRVAPTLAGLATTSPNAAGWYKAPVTMAWTCDDDRSGITAGVCPSSSTTTGEGSAVTTSAEVNDKAGNHTTATSQAVKIDLTAPSTGVSSPPTWSKDDVTLTLTATDALSGVTTTKYRVDGGADQTGTHPVVSGQGHHVVTFWSVDEAGNEETHGSVGVDIDTTAPSITPSLSPAPNAAGWNKGTVNVTFTCSDAGGSGVASCVGDRLFTTQADTVVTGEAADAAGNTATAQATVRIDLTAPTVTAQPPAANVHGWFNQPVQVPFSCTDTGGSGVASCPGPVTFSGQGKDQPVTATGSDLAGNEGTASGSTVSIDTTAPSISGAATTAPNGSGGYTTTATVHWTCSDALAGVASCPVDEVVTGEGTHTLTGSVTDKAGNTTTSQVTIRIDRDTSNDPGIVHGTITDAVTGQPAAGVQVALLHPTTAVQVLATTTGTDGTYVFPSVPDGTYKLGASKWGTYLQRIYPATSNFAAGQNLAVAHGTTTSADLALHPGHVLKGTVTSAGGTPIGGATVLLSNGVQTQTDASGRYEIKGIVSGSFTVKAIAIGFVTASSSVTFSGSSSTAATLDFALAAQPTATGMKGTIRSFNTGAPLAGATVRIWAKEGANWSITATTGSNGRFELPNLPAGDYHVDVVRGDYYVRWAADAATRTGASTITLTTSCTSTPDTTWGDPCATPVNVSMRQP